MHLHSVNCTLVCCVNGAHACSVDCVDGAHDCSVDCTLVCSVDGAHAGSVDCAPVFLSTYAPNESPIAAPINNPFALSTHFISVFV